jgi:hypothetical protein
MTADDEAHGRKILPVGQATDRSLSQLLGLELGHEALEQMHASLEEVRQNELEAERAVAQVRLK